MSVSPESASPREAEVLALLDAHLSNTQIAARLHISVRTVENHVSSLLRKYGVPDRRSLAAIAKQAQQVTANQGTAQQVTARVTGAPTWRTGFVGRALERDAVLAMLHPGRLVTLAGPGGVGKTRLAAVVATAAAPDLPHGAVFVDLVPVRDGQVGRAVATALGLSERPGQSLEEAVTSALGRDRRLLILDNCEHLLDAVADLADRVLSECPGTTILATSRERLGVPGDQVVPISPLPLASDAEALFVDRAAAADPGFTAEPAIVAEICARLDGMPLAIELAAARCASLGADGLLAALDDTLRLLSGSRSPDERHRSLRAVIGWSHDLLDDDERGLFPRLAAFAGAFDLDAACRVTPFAAKGAVADVLGRLVDKSLVVRDREAGSWRLLGTVRAYALDRLAASGDLAEVRDLHLRWAAETAHTLVEHLGGRWRDRFDAVCDDLRAALRDAPPGPGTLPHRLARSLGRLAYARRLVSEALDHFREAARRAPTAAAAAADLRTAAQAVYAVGLARGAFDLLVESAAHAEAAGDHDARAIALADAVVTACRFTSGFTEPIPRTRLRELLDQAVPIGDPGNPVVVAHLAAAATWCPHPTRTSPDPSLAGAAVAAARVTGDPVLISAALDAPGTLAIRTGGFRAAHRVARERLALVDLMDPRRPDCAAEILDSFHNAWLCAFAVGDLLAALSTAEQITHDDLLGTHPYRSASKLIPPLVLLGRFEEALERAQPMWHAWRRSGMPIAAWLSPAASAVALAHSLRGDHSEHRLWRARAERASGGPAPTSDSMIFAAFVDARVAVHTGAGEDPAALVSRAFAGSGTGWPAAYARAAGAELAVWAGLPGADRHLAAAAEAAGENDWATACLARARGRLHGDAASLRESLRGWSRIDARFEREHTSRLLTTPSAAPS
jgi:predicted ATPase/DNA-binding CsgD family transcriptional regulator